MEKVKAVPTTYAAPASNWTAPVRSAGPAIVPAAPVGPPPGRAPHVAASPEPPNPTSILDELVGSVEGVRAAILASVDGFGLARSSSMSDEASHPAMLAAAIGLAHQLVMMGGGAQLRQLVVDHDGGLMLVWPIGDQRVLAVLAATTVEQRRIRSFVQACASALVGAST
jgi:predicted regulator of Ras-like GTPase activity (Roadblock/LC7/MglB family)